MSQNFVLAKSQLDSATLKQLTMLEQKFFGHTYDNESDDERTKRIEKIIYGDAAEGNPQDRIKKLASVTYLDTRPDAPPPPVVQATKPTPPVPRPETHAPKLGNEASHPDIPAPKLGNEASHPDISPPKPDVSAAQPISDDVPPSKPGADDYPHVTALEKDILGSTYVGQPLSGRIVRMETKAFGAPSKSNDLGERTDNLEQYAEQKLHKKPFLAEEQRDLTYENSSEPQAGDSGTSRLQSAYPHITELENAILGQAYPDMTPEKRLAAMEVKAFGSASKSYDMSTRTDALEKYAEKTLHKKPFGQDVDYEVADGSPGGKGGEGRGKKLLSMVGNSLLGMAGVGGIAAGGGPGFAAPGMLGPSAFGPSGFSGIRVRRRQAAQQDEPSAAEEPSGPVEDPLVRAKDPPPPGTRLAIRVGWCEVQVFGKTSANLHLAERLTQLNRQLNFEPGRNAMELMDHIDGLVKASRAYSIAQANTAQAAPKGTAIGATSSTH